MNSSWHCLTSTRLHIQKSHGSIYRAGHWGIHLRTHFWVGKYVSTYLVILSAQGAFF